MKLIYFQFNLGMPFVKERFKNFYCRSWNISKNKAVELELCYYSKDLVDIHFDYGRNEDHAGLNIVIGLFGCSFRYQFYDTRHWSYETNDWEKYE
jgi:hypothetical protein